MKKTVFIFVVVVLISACSPAYYNTMEKFGVYKRDILVDRVEEARDSQEDTKEQFNSALEQFGSVVNYDGGSLEKIYNRLQSEYDDSVAAADDLGERIDAIEKVAEDLFEEWESELDDYSNDNMRRDSAQQLRNTRREYQSLIRAMRQAQSKIPPVLSVFQDQVLYLKHNLNARAISALQKEYKNIQTDVAALVAEMEQSIDEANAFIENMENS
jgi:DNA-binding ferritin-like protein